MDKKRALLEMCTPMPSFDDLIKREDITPDKIVWEFWQSCYSYHYGDELIVLIKYKNKKLKDGVDEGSIFCFGDFSVHKLLKLSNGKPGVDKTRALKRIHIDDILSPTNHREVFITNGVYEVLRAYLKDIEPQRQIAHIEKMSYLSDIINANI